MKKTLTRLTKGRLPTLLDIARDRHATLAILIGRQSITPDIETVHDIRVATRRLSQVVRLISPLMDKTSAKAVSRALRDLRQSSGRLRDLDVMHEHFEKWCIPPALQTTLAPLIKSYPDERKSLAAKLQKNLTSVATQTAMKVLRQLLTHTNPRQSEKTLHHIRQELCTTTDKRYRQFDKALSRATKKQTPDAFHQARIAAKKLRYVLELAHESGMQELTQRLTFLKTLQSDLGDMHDTDVILATLKKHLSRHATPAAKKSWPPFHHHLQQEQTARAARFFTATYQWRNNGQQHSL